MFGLNQGAPLLNELCNNKPPSAIFIQEHWQTPSNLFKILNFSDAFTGFGISAMTSVVHKSILRGRPFGGCAILINNSLITHVKPIAVSERFVIVSLGKYVLINVYLPCLSASSLNVIESLLNEVTGVLQGFAGYNFVFGGDLNCDVHVNSAVALIIRDFMSNLNLEFCDDNLTANEKVTYHHATMDHNSYIDFLFLSKDIRSTVTEYSILDHALNMSDHFPVSISFANDISLVNQKPDGQKIYPSKNQVNASHLRWDQANLANYYGETFKILEPLRTGMQNSYNFFMEKSNSSVAVDCRFNSNNKMAAVSYIETCYAKLVRGLNDAARIHIPALEPQSLKFWWSQVESDLKNNAILSHREWLNSNKPRSGQVHEAMKNDKYRYKIHLREQKKSHLNGITDSLCDNLIRKDSKTFWKTFNSKLGAKKKIEKVIDGNITDSDIAENFALYFAKICSPNSPGHFINAQDVFRNNILSYSRAELVSKTFITLDLVDSTIHKLKKGKAASLDKLTAEHVMYAHPCVTVIIFQLLNMMVMYEYVPDAFGQTVTIPIPKETNQCNSSSEHYRGITISPIVSKIFEYCLLDRFAKYLSSSKYQFGFKQKISCGHAHYSLQKTLEYFISRDSTVNLCSIDLSKAFDKLNRYVLFNKLMSRNCPLQFINVLDCWLNKTYTSAKWGNCLSKLVHLPNGVRQGSVLGPILFSVYTHDLLQKLQESNLGCHIHYINFNAFMYADDLLLLSISLFDLKQMLDICVSEFDVLDMNLNVKKSCCMRIGKRYDCAVADICVKNRALPWVKQMVYLGMSLTAGRSVRYDFHIKKVKFFGAINSILGKIGTSSLNVALSLTEAKCFPILTYGLEAINLTKSQLANLCFVFNTIFVKLFSTFDKYVIEQCQFFTGFLPLNYKLDIMRINFLIALKENCSSPASILFKLLGTQELSTLCDKYTIPACSTHNNRFCKIWSAFTESVIK
jgi:hypothetical protein